MTGEVKSGTRRTDARARTQLTLVAVAAALACGAIATAARAQDPGQTISDAQGQLADPGETCADSTGQSIGCDTKYTPVGKDGEEIGWQQVAGAIHPGAESRPTLASGYDPEATPVTVDLYSVSFRNENNGLAAGAQCEQDPPAEIADPQTQDAKRALDDYLRACTRVPVIYRYELDQGTARWHQVYRGDDPGFVGAIDWLGIDPQTHEPRALAVGGDGCYPRREDRALCPPGNLPPADAPDPIAGAGRAWLMSGTRWRDAGAPDSMTGMNALDVSSRPGDCVGAVQECAFAGGLRQIWMWKDGDFDPIPWTTNSGQQSRPVNAPGTDWRSRVRAIRFSAEGRANVFAAAVTAGCCDGSESAGQANPAMPGARLLGFSRDTGAWGVGALSSLADSGYALTFEGGVASERVSALLSPGGPERAAEQPPMIARRLSPPPVGTGGSDSLREPEYLRLSSARLVAGDGDLQGQQASSVEEALGNSAGSDPDGLMDWAVGGLRTSEQAAAFTTTAESRGIAGGSPIFIGQGPDAPYPLTCSLAKTPPERAAGDCQVDQTAGDRTRSGTLFSLSSYFLNGFTLVGNTGVGWAVGDRGAIERLGGDATAATLPPETPPKVGAKQQGSAPAASPYRGTAPQSAGSPGDVPSLASQPERKLPAPALSAYGSPNPRSYPVVPAFGGEGVSQIAMSRDGSEGWAIGRIHSPRGNEATTLYHFTGFRWSRCETHTVEGALAADPACEAVDPLARYGSGVRLSAIASVPMENGSDPTGADDFEAVAAGSFPQAGGQGSTPKNAVIRYRDGRWLVDEEASNQLGLSWSTTITDIAFSRPDDGWLIGTGGPFDMHIFHFNGEEWIACNSGTPVTPDENVDECEDTGPHPVLPVGPAGAFSIPAGGVHLARAGQRIYMYGGRRSTDVKVAGGDPGNGYPFVLYKDPGQPWKQAYDPGCSSFDANGACVGSTDSSTEGALYSLSVAQGPDGSFNGWGVGRFGSATQGTVPGVTAGGGSPVIHSGPDGITWRPEATSGPADEYLLGGSRSKSTPRPDAARVVAMPAEGGDGGVVITPTVDAGVGAEEPLIALDPATERWNVVPTPFVQLKGRHNDTYQQANVQALASDNSGGFWLAATPAYNPGSWFYRYSSSAPSDVFEDSPHPIRERITAATGAPDGSFWVATNSNVVYRYDRATGWDRMAVPGWDPGRVVTRASEAHAIAVGPDGEGLLVGEQGRIAEVSPAGAVLDASTGVLCSQSPNTSPCGTGRDLRAVAIAPDDGSAMAGGDGRALLYREGQAGSFAAITPPPTAVFATITGISLPSPGEAWLTTDTGEIWAGQGSGQSWSWTREDADSFGDSIGRDELGRQPRLNAISLDPAHHGYVVGDEGTILERTGNGEQPWRRIQGYMDDLTSVTLGSDGRTALIGGAYGLILTGGGAHFEPARQADYFAPANFGRAGPAEGGSEIVGLALMPGYSSGQVEAWAASQVQSTFQRVPAPGAILHHSSDPSDPLLDGVSGPARPLPDSLPPKPDDLSFAAFGNSGCQQGSSDEPCPELTGSNQANDVIARGIRDQLLAASEGPGGPDFGVFTGDVGDVAGTRRSNTLNTPLDQSLVHERWIELIADPLLAGGVPGFGALGARDLSNTQFCLPPANYQCTSTHSTRTGPNLAWRAAMGGMPAPWGEPGAPEAPSHDGLSFVGVDTENPKVEPGDQTVDGTTIPTGGARTHYAFDVERGDEKLLRVVFLDTSLRSLAASDPEQNPTEEQLTWLREVLQRPAGERAVVVSNTPTYSFGPGALSDTQQDGTALESVLIANDVDLVVSGRLGWNAVYWALAPGLHCPRAGDPQPDPNSPPTDASCAAQTDSPADQALTEAQAQVGETIGGGAGAGEALPFVVASSAGGMFGPDGSGTGSAADGYWRGYTEIHIDPTTDDPPVIEQRPVFDWIGIAPKSQGEATHVLRANKRLTLLGYGREPAGMDVPFRYDEISSPSITHRFDLVEADPAKPWLPKEAPNNGVQNQASVRLVESDPCGSYLCLDPKVGTIDPQSGQVRAGNGNYSRTFAIAQLSVGEQVATYPLVFEPRASYRAPTQAQAPPVAVPPPPPPPAPAQPTTPQVNLPAAPVLPVLTAQALAPPPVPPTPPTFASEAPLDLNLSPTALDATPPTAVSQPPTPPVNPAPPSGARREARQRQAAAQKSGADSDQTEEGGDGQATDLADSPPSAHGSSHATRHDFTAVANREQPSAWARDALLGGGLGIAALILAMGLGTARPTPRRRQPELPAPAESRAWSRRD